MKQEDKELLLRDICARLPYGLMLRIGGHDVKFTTNNTWIYFGASDESKEYIKPYLRPMSSMTKEEREEYNKMQCVYGLTSIIKHGEMTDWLHAHHFDYRGLIEKGLALEAPKGMYDLQV